MNPLLYSFTTLFKADFKKKVAILAGTIAGCVWLCLGNTAIYAIGDQAPFDVNHFLPAPGSGKFVVVDTGQVGSMADDVPAHGTRLEIVPQLFFHYAYRPLAFTLAGCHISPHDTSQPGCHPVPGSVTLPDIIKQRFTADFSISFALWKRFQIALALPVTLYETGEAITPDLLPVGVSPTPKLAVAGQGDLRISLKGVLLDTMLWGGKRDLNFGIAVIGDLSVPTGNANSFLGSRLPTFNLRLVASLSFKRFSLAINFGGIFEKAESLYTSDAISRPSPTGNGIGDGLLTGNGLTYGVGAQIEIVKKPKWSLYALTEIFGLTHYPFQNLRQSPAELSVAFKAALKNGWTFFLGGGPGLNPGYGIPDGRVYGGISYAWHQAQEAPPLIPPIPVPPDACPGLAGGPFKDVPIGYMKGPDGKCVPVPNVCPIAPGGPHKKVPKGYMIGPDGKCMLIPPPKPVDVCPAAPNGPHKVVPAGYMIGADGKCVEIPPPPPVDVCPAAPFGPHATVPEGYTIGPDGRCVLAPKRTILQVTGEVYFPFNKDIVLPPSYPVLDGVIRTMQSQPKQKIRISGHTDSKGGDLYNLDLSQRRAAMVLKYLIGEIENTVPWASKRGLPFVMAMQEVKKNGQTVMRSGKPVMKRVKVVPPPNFWIDPSRLTSLGFGKTCPAEMGTTEANRQNNRRVEFTEIVNPDGVATSTQERCDITKIDQILKEAALAPKKGKGGKKGRSK